MESDSPADLRLENEKLKKQLEETESLLKTFVDASYDGYWDWHIQDEYEYMSPRFWEIFGFDASEKKHHPSEWQDLIFQDDLKVALENFSKHSETKGKHPYVQEVRYRHKTGSTVTVLCRGKVVSWDNDGKPLRMIGTHTDITPLKEAYSRHSATAQMASLGEMAAGIAHEINNPLAIVKQGLKVIEKKMSADSKAQLTEIMEKMRFGVDRVAAIVESMRRLSRSDDNAGLQACIANEVIQDIRVISESRISEARIGFRVKGEDSVEFPMGRSELGQVLVNLVSNAIDAVKSKDGERWIEVEFFSSDVGRGIRVVDSGDGIGETARKRLFDPFYTSKPVGKGTGLGLSLSKTLVERGGGSISLLSDADHTTFEIRFGETSRNE